MPPASVVVFLDWQNVYKRARDAFCGSQAPHWEGQVNPVKLAQYLAMDGDFAVMAARGEYDVGILMSTDTDLRPALEYVFDQGRAWGKPRAEVAAWSAPGQRRRLSITNGSLYCHWMEKNVYEQVADGTDYSKP
jgi:hypothetical protein